MSFGIPVVREIPPGSCMVLRTRQEDAGAKVLEKGFWCCTRFKFSTTTMRGLIGQLSRAMSVSLSL